MQTILILKIIHVVGFVSWMAGLFYLGRMFVYHREALDLNEPEQSILANQYELMEKRVYGIICNPAMIITWVAGIAMIYFYGYEWFKSNLWLHFKIMFLLILSGYQGYCKPIMRKLSKGVKPMNSLQFRLFNEVPTVILILASSLAIFKNQTSPIILVLTTLAIIGLLIFFTFMYKKIRKG